VPQADGSTACFLSLRRAAADELQRKLWAGQARKKHKFFVLQHTTLLNITDYSNLLFSFVAFL
jgi:hypothetical protein